MQINVPSNSSLDLHLILMWYVPTSTKKTSGTRAAALSQTGSHVLTSTNTVKNGVFSRVRFVKVRFLKDRFLKVTFRSDPGSTSLGRFPSCLFYWFFEGPPRLSSSFENWLIKWSSAGFLRFMLKNHLFRKINFQSPATQKPFASILFHRINFSNLFFRFHFYRIHSIAVYFCAMSTVAKHARFQQEVPNNVSVLELCWNWIEEVTEIYWMKVKSEKFIKNSSRIRCFLFYFAGHEWVRSRSRVTEWWLHGSIVTGVRANCKW